MTKRQCENTYFLQFFVKNCQKIPGVFINIYRKDKILLQNYMKLYYNNSCENVTANITENNQRCLQRQF